MTTGTKRVPFDPLLVLSHHRRLLGCIDESTTTIVELRCTNGRPIRFQIIASARCTRLT